MNKRIQELAKEHLLHGKYNGDGDVIEGEYYEFDPEELQKFAELIIQKCINYGWLKPVATVRDNELFWEALGN